ncbi:MAG: hypothetical protein WA809_03085 [Candidatus Dormiibacterota bacterium]
MPERPAGAFELLRHLDLAGVPGLVPDCSADLVPGNLPIWVSWRRPESCSSRLGSNPLLSTTWRSTWKYPWASSCSLKVAPTTSPVASSIAPTRVR